MFATVSSSLSSALPSNQWMNSLRFTFSCDLIIRIKQILVDSLSQWGQRYERFNASSNEVNLKGIAMLSCVCLVALLIISMLRCGDDTRLVSPPTPTR